jgi:hypothetical protein
MEHLHCAALTVKLPSYVTCDLCSSRIIGSRFMCFRRYDYNNPEDYCVICFKSPELSWRFPGFFQIIQCTRAIHRREMEPLLFSAYEALTKAVDIFKVDSRTCRSCHRILIGSCWACVYCRSKSTLFKLRRKSADSKGKEPEVVICNDCSQKTEDTGNVHTDSHPLIWISYIRMDGFLPWEAGNERNESRISPIRKLGSFLKRILVRRNSSNIPRRRRNFQSFPEYY